MLKGMFSDKEFLRKLLRLTFPIALQNLMLALVAASDAVMLGRLDQNAMAAVSLATQIQFVQNMMLGAVVSVVAILGAQYWGKNDKRVLGEIFGISIRKSPCHFDIVFCRMRFLSRILDAFVCARSCLD